jgi:hypothetical protein
MNRRLVRTLFATAALALVAGCVSGQTTWYEQRCERLGLSKGTAEFEKCVQRDQAWVDADQKRAASTKQR